MAMKRSDRVADEMKRILARTIQQEVKDPRIAEFATVTDVKVTGDIGHATIGVSVIGDDQKKRETLDGLNAAKGFMRTRLAQEMRIRQVPELHFELDDTAEQAMHMDRLIDEAMGRGDETESDDGQEG